MRKKKKYMVSVMPFHSYAREKQRLQSSRQQGWQVTDCSLFGYSLLYGAPADKKIRLVLSRNHYSLQRAQYAPWRLICSSPLLHVLEGEKDAPPFRDAWSLPLVQDYRLKSRFWLRLGISTIFAVILLLLLLSITKPPSSIANFLFFVLSIIVSATIISFSRWLWVRFVLSKANCIISESHR